MSIEESLTLIEQRLAAVRPPEADSLAAGSGVAISRYVEGLSNEQELQGELEALGYSGPRLANFLLQAQLRRELEIYQARKAIWAKRLGAGEITEGEFRTLLERMDAEPEAIELEVAKVLVKPVSAAIQSAEIFLSILSGELVAARPTLAPSEVFLSIEEASAVEGEPVIMAPSEISLSVEAAEEAPGPSVAVSSEIFLEVLAIKEV